MIIPLSPIPDFKPACIFDRKPMSIVEDKREEFMDRVRAINAIGLSGDPKALGMLAIISNDYEVEDDGLRRWADFWINDLKTEFGLSDDDINRIRSLSKASGDDVTDELAIFIEQLTASKEIKPDYRLDSYRIKSSIPETSSIDIRAFRPGASLLTHIASGVPNLDTGGLAEIIRRKLGTGDFHVVELPDFNSPTADSKFGIRMIRNFCAQARSGNAMAAFMLRTLKPMLDGHPSVMVSIKEAIAQLGNEDKQLLAEFGFTAE